ncbi:YciI family protein [Thermoleophilia bacterium SCSIO 60948]|nr:YciI family protein [Thermoleophilia bacterium SCSIO 60948]
MRVMVIIKSTPEIESGRMPSEAELSAMGAFNEELVKAGVMLGGEGLLDSSHGKRISYETSDPDEEPSVVDGPFAESKELVAGFWILEVDSVDEAVERMRGIPNSPDTNLEIRRIAEAEDFGDEFTPELQERENAMREQVEGRDA